MLAGMTSGSILAAIANGWGLLTIGVGVGVAIARYAVGAAAALQVHRRRSSHEQRPSRPVQGSWLGLLVGVAVGLYSTLELLPARDPHEGDAG